MKDKLHCSIDGHKIVLNAEKASLSPFKVFNASGEFTANQISIISALLNDLKNRPKLAIICHTDFFDKILMTQSEFRNTDFNIFKFETLATAEHTSGFLAKDFETAFIAEIDMNYIFDLNYLIRQNYCNIKMTITPAVISDICPELIPTSAWVTPERNIYPIQLPQIAIQSGLDVLLMDCPSRNLALMPNGLAYVHNALKKSGVKHQTFDLDIVVYHRYHINRLFNIGAPIVLPSGYELPNDPWKAEHYDVWSLPEVIDYFDGFVNEIATAILQARPKVLALSITACNEAFSRRVVNKVRMKFPEVIILVGGYSCNIPDIGLRAFQEADYMCIGEADLSIVPLVRALANNECPANLPGVVSRFDDPKIPYMQAPMPHDIDSVDYPKYEWFGIDIYINFNGYRLTPVIASRGCRWARCTFCAERFYWRIRTPEKFVDELEWLARQGCHIFMFNESDLNGHPEMLEEICDEIIQRGLDVILTGQLRIHKKGNSKFFQKLRAAGFTALRFGVDAFSENSMRLQKKGYTQKTVLENLKACHEAGIRVTVNWVIGVPGETNEDIDEAIAFMLSLKPYISAVENINPLILVNGGIYWMEPERHNIKFRLPKEQLYDTYARVIPAKFWYSEEPYIDAHVRKQWFERIVLRLYEENFPIGDWAQRVVNDVLNNKDKNRTEDKIELAKRDALDVPQVTFIREYRGYNIYSYGSAYYGILAELANIDDIIRDSTPPGSIRDVSQEAIVSFIEKNEVWADFRGVYGSTYSQKLSYNQLETGKRLITFQNKVYKLDQTEIERQLAGLNIKVTGSQKIIPLKLEWNGVLVSYAGDFKIICDGERHYVVPMSLPRMEPYMLDDLKQYGIEAHNSWELATARARQLSDADRPASIFKTVEAKLSKVSNVLKGVGAASEAMTSDPSLIMEYKGYRLFGYEGVIYGLPEKLHDVDLKENDVISWPGVIRDVSRHAVIEQIDEAETIAVEKLDAKWPRAVNPQ